MTQTRNNAAAVSLCDRVRVRPRPQRQSSHSAAQFLKTGYVSPFRRRKEQALGSNLEWDRGCVDRLMELMEEAYMGRRSKR